MVSCLLLLTVGAHKRTLPEDFYDEDETTT